jgi:hypothetical protein
MAQATALLAGATKPWLTMAHDTMAHEELLALLRIVSMSRP